MKVLKLAAWAAATLLIALNVQAHSPEDESGESDDSCWDWLAARRTNDRIAHTRYVSWVQGYISGVNGENIPAKGVKVPANTVVEAHLDTKCVHYPRISVSIHAGALYLDLERQQRESPKKRVSSGAHKNSK